MSSMRIPGKITVVGPGAMGCLLAAFMARAGVPISLLDYKEKRAEELANKGISVLTDEGTWWARPFVTAEPKELGPQDVIIIMVKTYQTASALSRISQLLGSSTLVVSLQNGLGADEQLKALAPPGGVALGTTSQGATLLEDGVVRHAGTGPTRLGMVSKGKEGTKTLDALAETLHQAGWPCEAVEDIYPFIWEKLLVNVGINALTALTGLRNGELLVQEEAVKLQESLVTEAYMVANKAGVNMKMELSAALEMVKGVCRATAENKSSMLQDRLKKRPTEIDYINGAVCRIGREAGLTTPVNDTVTRLVRLSCATGWGRTQENH